MICDKNPAVIDHLSAPRHIAIVMSEVFLRRLTPALMPFVGAPQDFRIVSIDRPVQELIRLLEVIQPQGLITEWLPEVTENLLQLDIPTVIVDTDKTYAGVTSIDVDDWAVGATAAEALQLSGLQNFACLGNGTPYSAQRIEGFCRQLGQADAVLGTRQLPEKSCISRSAPSGAERAKESPTDESTPHVLKFRPRQAVSVFTEKTFKNTGYSEHFLEPNPALNDWLSRLPKPVGIFAVHDPLGRFLCSTCRELGIAIPEQVAVMGANNDELVCGLSYPMLSSVAIPWDRIGGLAGQAMQRLLAGEPPPKRSILAPPGSAVLRHSANHLAVEDVQLRRAMTYLTGHLAEPVTIGGMCRALRLGRRSLERAFRETYRHSPWEMLCRLRVGRAKQLLLETNHPIGHISELCGFNDAERMTVVFRRITGETPSKFRRTGAG
ncbi:MAG: substrate-binding domain-containing protein [Verrucomicrobia bacterium]|nr:substrate-binding domain-containing protein [Verrucomicrobiota bacterium]